MCALLQVTFKDACSLPDTRAHAVAERYRLKYCPCSDEIADIALALYFVVFVARNHDHVVACV